MTHINILLWSVTLSVQSSYNADWQPRSTSHYWLDDISQIVQSRLEVLKFDYQHGVEKPQYFVDDWFICRINRRFIPVIWYFVSMFDWSTLIYHPLEWHGWTSLLEDTISILTDTYFRVTYNVLYLDQIDYWKSLFQSWRNSMTSGNNRIQTIINKNCGSMRN